MPTPSQLLSIISTATIAYRAPLHAYTLQSSSVAASFVSSAVGRRRLALPHRLLAPAASPTHPVSPRLSSVICP
jgi:hypothetical protein